MTLYTFKGGIHPYDGKDLSRDMPIMELTPGKELVYLLAQHIGAPARACVSKGEHVLVRQKIAEADGLVSAPVHSSVSGTVKAIEKRKNAAGDLVDAVVIENDEKYESVPDAPAVSLDDLTPEEIRKRIREAGVVGMGGAGFPTHVKLSPKESEKIEYVLVNGAECEPYLTSDYRCMLEYPDEIVKGLECILKLFDKAEGVICIEDNKPEAITVMERAVREHARMRVAVCKTKYPEGAERCMIDAVTGRKVNSSMLPADVGCIVDNIDTVIAIHDAVLLGRPLIHRIFTISGDAIVDPRNYSVPVGMSYQEIIDRAGGFRTQPEKVISGGPMMGFSLYDLSIPVTKTSGAIVCFKKDVVARSVETPCIKCGRCVRGCPARLLPYKLCDYAEHGDMEKFEEAYGLECVECGSCSFSCPAKRPLAANIKAMRSIVLASKRK